MRRKSKLIIKKRSEVYVNGISAIASSASSKVVTFDTTIVNLGSAISYIRDTVNGDTFTINENGIYSLVESLAFTTGNHQHGITINTSGADLTTAMPSVTRANVLTVITNPTGTDCGAGTSITLFLQRGDVIRVQLDGATLSSATPQYTYFRIIRVA